MKIELYLICNSVDFFASSAVLSVFKLFRWDSLLLTTLETGAIRNKIERLKNNKVVSRVKISSLDLIYPSILPAFVTQKL